MLQLVETIESLNILFNLHSPLDFAFEFQTWSINWNDGAFDIEFDINQLALIWNLRNHNSHISSIIKISISKNIDF